MQYGAKMLAQIWWITSFVTLAFSHKCHRNIESLWLTETGSSPVVSSPLIADIGGDNVLDVAVTTFDGHVSIMDGQTGRELPGWPFVALKATYHAAPLLYDVDKDGLNEVVLSTSNGDIVFVKADGKLVSGQNVLQVPPIKLMRDWYRVRPNQPNANEPRLNAIFAEKSEFLTTKVKEDTNTEDMSVVIQETTTLPSGLSSDGIHVYVDPHILSTPVIADFNQDGLENELIVAVNFYFDETKLLNYPKDSGLPAKELENYLGCGLVVFDLDSGDIIHKVVLEVTKRSSVYPGYVLSLPTVLDNTSVVVGTSVGNIYLVKYKEIEPKMITTMDSIQGQITVADVNDDGNPELIVVDDSGNVACIDLNGKRVWESRISGSATSGIRAADINGDNMLDVVFASYDGYVWALNGDSGKGLPGWPINLHSEIRATVLVTKLRPGEEAGLDLVVPLLDGVLAIIRGRDQCTEFIETGLPVFSSVVAAKLLPWKQGLEVVVGGNDGTVMCLGDPSNSTTKRNDIVYEELFSWKAETNPCSGTTYNSGKVGVVFTRNTKDRALFSGSGFTVEFEITDLQANDLRWNNYRTKIFIGNKKLVFNKTLLTPGVHQQHIPIPPLTGKAVIIIKMVTPNGHCFQDSFHISVDAHQLDDLYWYLLMPFMTMSSILLLLHGTPHPGEILPTIMRRS